MKRSRTRKFLDSIKSLYWIVVPYDWRPGELWYRLTCWAWKRYTTVKSRYLPHTYCDSVVLLPCTMFEILSRFIEKECSPGHVDWVGTGHMVKVHGKLVNVRDEMQEIYDWWHTDYHKRRIEEHDRISQLLTKHRPTSHTVPYDDDDKVCSEEAALYFEWDPQFKSEEDRFITQTTFDSMHAMDRAYEKRLNEMMHRLVNLTPYLWT